MPDIIASIGATNIGDAVMHRVVQVEDTSDARTARLRLEFVNGYSASVIRGPYSYGGSQGFFEFAVFYGDDLDYTTPITDDVIGGQNVDEIVDLITQVSELPAKTRELESKGE